MKTKAMQIGCKGFFRLELAKGKKDADGNYVYDKDGMVIPDESTRRVVRDWTPNKILNSGRNRMGSNSDWLNACQVGTDGTAPTSTDTGLLGYVAGTSDIQETISTAQATPPYYGYKRRRFRFALGATAANLSEVGVGWSTSNGAFLVSRANIFPTVTPLADEILDVWYEMRYYPPLLDVTGTVTLNSVSYDYTIRASEVNIGEYGDLIGNAIGEYSPGAGAGVDWVAYDGSIGTILQAPSGTSYSGSSDPSNDAYSNNSYQRRMTVSQDTTGWNVPGGIRSIRIKTTAGRFQMELAATSGGGTVPKDLNYTMIMVWIISWEAVNANGDWNMIAASDSTTPAAGEWNTNLAGTTLRIAWDDVDANDWQTELKAEVGSVFRITDSTDPTKWVEYTVNSAFTEFATWTEYPVSQTGIGNSGPTVGNECNIRNLIQ